MDWYSRFRRDVGIICTIIAVANGLAWAFHIGYDDTDGAQRSGLALYTDAKTGCQYIGAGASGQIIPRVDASGNHMCKKGIKN